MPALVKLTQASNLVPKRNAKCYGETVESDKFALQRDTASFCCNEPIKSSAIPGWPSAFFQQSIGLTLLRQWSKNRLSPFHNLACFK